MTDAARGAGLVYFCNPNNPTATVHGKSDVAMYVEQVNRTSPETTILIDEAYHEYVEDPAYGTAIPHRDRQSARRRDADLLEGVRHGRPARSATRSASPTRSRRCRRGCSARTSNQLALAAAMTTVGDKAHIADEVQKKNREARAFTRKFFETRRLHGARAPKRTSSWSTFGATRRRSSSSA